MVIVLSYPSALFEVWQRFAGKWATGDAGQKPYVIEVRPLLSLKGFSTRAIAWLKTVVSGQVEGPSYTIRAEEGE